MKFSPVKLPGGVELPGAGTSVPGLGRSSRVGNGNPLQCSCQENSMDRGAWQVTVHRVAYGVGHV